MDSNQLTIVCYTGGTCGDLISALIDDRDARIEGTVIKHSDDRARLKKPHLFSTSEEKDEYLLSISKKYSSVPSHDLDYHKQRSHKFMSITVADPKVALWAAERFKQLHRPHVWEEMTRVCGANDVQGYAEILIHYSNMVVNYAEYTVQLEDIISGTVLDALEKYVPVPESGKNIYKTWLEQQNI